MMSELSTPVSSRTIHTISLAYFAHAKGVSDSVRDLCTAGFDARHIRISRCTGQNTRPLQVADGTALPNAIGSHSLQWIWKRLWAHDRRRRGADQMSGYNPLPSEGPNPTCFSFDLPITLRAMGVPSEVITLLQGDYRKAGAFLLVDAPSRVAEADSILDGNAGYIRTGYLRVKQA